MAESFTVFIDVNYDASERRAIGEAIIDYVVNRTKRGRGIDGEAFTNREGKKSYSKAYQGHRDFDIGGKSSSPINLTLTGDMLASIEILDSSLAGRVVIGIPDGENADKARYMREKGYDFLGISENEKANILAKYSKVKPEEVKRAQLSESVAKSFLKSLING